MTSENAQTQGATMQELLISDPVKIFLSVNYASFDGKIQLKLAQTMEWGD